MSEVAPNTEVQNLEDGEQQSFLRKALVTGSTALVQSIMLMPDTFEMPGFTLVTLSEETECEPGMIYDQETGKFSIYTAPEVSVPVEEPVTEPVTQIEPTLPAQPAQPEQPESMDEEPLVNVTEDDPLSQGDDVNEE